MKDKLVPVYHAHTSSDAEGLADRLRRAGVEAFVEHTESPMYGMRAGAASKVVYVRQAEAQHIHQVVHTWEHEGHPGVPPDERQGEETGLEMAAEDERTGDSPAEGVAEMTERMDQNRPGPDTAEIDAISATRLDEEEIEAFGVDRDIEQPAEVEQPEFEDQPIDSLNAEALMSEEMDQPGVPEAMEGEPSPDELRHARGEHKRRQPRRHIDPEETE